jgi:uncharacterized membrane protein
MLMLTLGVILWSFAHLFKRLAPTVREGMGDGGKLVVTLALIGSIALMTSGYQSAVGSIWWVRQPSWVLLSNALMLLALYLMVASSLKVRVTRLVRHPQLTAIKAWSVGHLLVNGDVPSFVLFGGLLIWAVITVIVINRQEGKPALPSIDTSLPRELFAVIVTGVLYFGVAQAHAYLGYPVHG